MTWVLVLAAGRLVDFFFRLVRAILFQHCRLARAAPCSDSLGVGLLRWGRAPCHAHAQPVVNLGQTRWSNDRSPTFFPSPSSPCLPVAVMQFDIQLDEEGAEKISTVQASLGCNS